MVTGVRHSLVTAVWVHRDKAEPRPSQAVILQVRVRETQAGHGHGQGHRHISESTGDKYISDTAQMGTEGPGLI